MLGEPSNQQETIDPNNESLKSDQDMAQIEQQGSEIQEISQVVQETIDSSETISAMADKIEQSETVSKDTIAVAQEAISYFAKRTGLKMAGLSSSMESFCLTSDKQIVLNEMRLASDNLNDCVAIAQEGIIDRIKNRFSLIFTSSDRLRKELREVSDQYDKNGPKQGVIINPAFARRLNREEKTLLKEIDVINLAGEIDKKVHDPKLIDAINGLTASINGVSRALSKSGMVFTDKESIKEINAEYDVISGIYEEVAAQFVVGRQKKNTDIEPLSPANKEKIVKLVNSLLDIKEYERYEDGLTDATDRLYDIITRNRNTKISSVIIKMDSADTDSAVHADRQAQKVYNIISNLMGLRFTIAHACVKYIKASTAA